MVREGVGRAVRVLYKGQPMQTEQEKQGKATPEKHRPRLSDPQSSGNQSLALNRGPAAVTAPLNHAPHLLRDLLRDLLLVGDRDLVPARNAK